MIAVHESALDSIKAMGQRDKDEIDRLRHVIQISIEYAKSARAFATAEFLSHQLRVNTYSKPDAEKAE